MVGASMGRVPIMLLVLAGCFLVAACVISKPRTDWDIEAQQQEQVLMERMHNAGSIEEMHAIQKDLDVLHSKYYYDLTFEDDQKKMPPMKSEEEKKKAVDETIDKALEEINDPPNK
jgi:hypothetical protein